MTALTPAPDATPAEWIVAALQTFAESVHSIVPTGFASYVRVFHPASRFERESWRPVRWGQITDANGTVAHGGMQLGAVTGAEKFERRGQPGVYDQPPDEGSLPPEIGPALVAVLSRHTSTPERCRFGVWHGFAGMPEEIRRAPTFRVPRREYFLLTGSIEGATASVYEGVRRQTPNIWWPEDRSELEALQIDPATGIDWTSDAVNALPTV